jgi:hypothetical protein
MRQCRPENAAMDNDGNVISGIARHANWHHGREIIVKPLTMSDVDSNESMKNMTTEVKHRH